MINYSVRFGDTLSRIAQQMNTTVQRLARINDIANPNVIQAGEQLKVPGQGGAQGQQLAIPGQRDEFVPAATGKPPVSGIGAEPSLAATGNSTQVPPTGDSAQALDVARSLIGRAYGDPAGASGAAVGRDSPFMHCAQFVNAVYPDLPPSAPQLTAMATPGAEPQPGDVLCSNQPAPWGHVGIMTEQGTVIHSIPGRGVHESSLAEFEASSPVTGVISR